MENPIVISTGLVYKFMNDRNEMIQRLKEFSPDGIEISFAYPQYLYEFVLESRNLMYLQGLRFNSIHAPWKEIVYGKNAIPVLERIDTLYDSIHARNVVFHKAPEDDFSVLRDYNFAGSVENDDWKKGLNTPEKIGEILEQNPNLRFTFDFAHALTIDTGLVPEFLSFGNKISQVHLSYLDRQMPDHYFLFKHDSEEMRRLIRMIPSNIPLVLECVADNPSEIELVRREIEYLRSV